MSRTAGRRPPLVLPARPALSQHHPSSHLPNLPHDPHPIHHAHPTNPTTPSPSRLTLANPRQTPLHRGCSGWASPVEANVS